MPTADQIYSDKMQRSDEAFDEAMLLFNAKHYNGSANRLYYSAFYGVFALVFRGSGQYSKTRSGLKSLFNEHFIKTKKLDSKLSTI